MPVLVYLLNAFFFSILVVIQNDGEQIISSLLLMPLYAFLLIFILPVIALYLILGGVAGSTVAGLATRWLGDSSAQNKSRSIQDLS